MGRKPHLSIMATQPKQVIKNLKHETTVELNRFTRDVYLEIIKTTPKRTGAASRAWTKPEKVSDEDLNAVISTNRLPYVPRLEAGSSKQAPDGFIAPSIDKILTRYNK